MLRAALGSLARRGRRSAPASALRIAAHDRATALRVAADLRRLGGLPSRRDPRRYEFTTAERRDGALGSVRCAYGWTCAEAEHDRGPLDRARSASGPPGDCGVIGGRAGHPGGSASASATGRAPSTARRYSPRGHGDQNPTRIRCRPPRPRPSPTTSPLTRADDPDGWRQNQTS
jgi:hypothetical protein